MGRSSSIDARRVLVFERTANRFLLLTREPKVPKPRQTLQFERPWDRPVLAKSIRKLTAHFWVSKRFLLRKAYRIRRLLVGSSFPRVRRRTTTAITTSTANTIPMFSGVIKPG